MKAIKEGAKTSEGQTQINAILGDQYYSNGIAHAEDISTLPVAEMDRLTRLIELKEWIIITT